MYRTCSIIGSKYCSDDELLWLSYTDDLAEKNTGAKRHLYFFRGQWFSNIFRSLTPLNILLSDQIQFFQFTNDKFDNCGRSVNIIISDPFK